MKKLQTIIPTALIALAIILPYSAHAVAITSTLAVGSSGPQVTTLQQTLVKYGYLKSTPTGYYGALTEAAVAYLQRTNGLPPVGYTGPQTRNLINGANGATGSTASTASSGTASLASGGGSTVGSVSGASTASTASELSTLQTLEAQLAQLETEAGMQGSTGSAATTGTTQTGSVTVDTSSVATPAVINRTLAPGSSGADVLELQQTLVKLGYLQAAPTGYYGALTSIAVARFQSANGLSAVGYTGPKTRQLLNGIIETAVNSGSSVSSTPASTDTSTDSTQSSTTSTTDDTSSDDSTTVTTSTDDSGGGGGGDSSTVTSSDDTSDGSSDTTSDDSGSTGSSDTSSGSSDTTTGGGSTIVTTPTTPVTTPNAPVVLAPTLTFTAGTTTVAMNASTTLTWSSTNASQCVASGDWSGPQPLNSSRPVTDITSAKSFTLTCTGEGGTVSKTIAVTIAKTGSTQPVTTPIAPITTPIAPSTPAPTLTFTASTTTAPLNGSVTLMWTTTNAIQCTASGDWSGAQAVIASRTITDITSAKSFTLECTGSGGNVAKSVAVAVAKTVVPPPVTTPTPPTTPVTTPPVTPPTAPTSPTPVNNVSYPVAAGCVAPTASAGNGFYVDAVNGSDTTGDGSKAKPWQTLNYVLTKQVSDSQYVRPFVNSTSLTAVNPTGAVHAGDTIFLMNGTYAGVSVIGVNSNFITIEPAPGQTPVIASINVEGADKWIIHGLKVQSLQNGYASLIAVSNGYYGPVNNIIVDSNNVSSQDDTSSWTQADWLAKGASVGIDMDTGTGARLSGCLTISNNDIHDIQTGMAVGVDNSLITHNTINNFAHDALDYDANNLLINHNYITNARWIDANHPDGMQGQIGRLDSTDSTAGYSNITIDSNLIVRESTPGLPFMNGLQGIDGFDMNWTNLVVTNNVVLTNLYQGISFASVHGGLIANNTLMYDNTASPNDYAPTTWLTVGATTHEGTPSNNVLVENNIAYSIIQGTLAATFLNNITPTTLDLLTPSGTTQYFKAPGTYAGNNIINPNIMTGFVKYDPTNQQYDLHLLPTSPANGVGTPNGAPTVDYDGHARSGNNAAGAYANSYSTSVVAATTTVTVKTTTTTSTTTVATPAATPVVTTQKVTTIATTTPVIATSTAKTTTTTSTTTATTTSKVALSGNRGDMLASVFTAYSQLLAILGAALKS